MISVDAIEQAVQRLPASELAEFRRWFSKFDEAAWDAQIEADAEAGQLGHRRLAMIEGAKLNGTKFEGQRNMQCVQRATQR